MTVRRSASAPRPDPEPTLLLTGGRLNNRYIVGLAGRAVPLTYTYYNVFTDLLDAQRDPKASGFASSRVYPMINRVAICRVRRVIDETLGKGAGMELIQSGSGEEYKLNVPPDQIAIDPSFPELVALKVITPEQLADLQGRFPTLPERWNGATAAAKPPTCANGDTSPAPATIRMTPRPRPRSSTIEHLASLG
jgi:hypothetical protein